MTKHKKKTTRRKRKVTLEQVVEAAVEAGAKVTVSLVPREERALLSVPIDKWPGDPSCRSIIADRVVTHKAVERAFKDNPTSKWVITPYDIIERDEYFRQKAAWEAEEIRKLQEVKCIVCGIPAAFPKLVTKPYTCGQCQQPQTQVKP